MHAQVRAPICTPEDAAVTLRDACAAAPPYVAVMVAEMFEATEVVITVNMAEVAPAATVTLDGTDTELELEIKLTTAFPAGAAPDSITVPWTEDPPATEAADNVTVKTAGATVPFCTAV